MSTEAFPRLVLLLVGFGVAGYFGFNMYSQSNEDRTVGSSCPAGWTGRWEYRQKAGDGYDEEGERLELSCRAGSLAGLYHGLEREGEHGLFYTLTEVRDLKLSPEDELTFTVPGRALFHQRPATLQEVEQKKLASAGFTRDELHMKGRLQGKTLSLSCTSQAISCPEDVMVFRSAP